MTLFATLWVFLLHKNEKHKSSNSFRSVLLKGKTQASCRIWGIISDFKTVLFPLSVKDLDCQILSMSFILLIFSETFNLTISEVSSVNQIARDLKSLSVSPVFSIKIFLVLQSNLTVLFLYWVSACNLCTCRNIYDHIPA